MPGFIYSTKNIFGLTIAICFQSCVVAIVVPDVDVIKCWALENGIKGTFSALCEDSRIKKIILDDMLQWGRTAGLKTFEQVRVNQIMQYQLKTNNAIPA